MGASLGLERVRHAGAPRLARSWKELIMLMYIAIGLLVLWLLGLVTGFLGNLIYIVLVVAVVLFLVNFITGRKTV